MENKEQRSLIGSIEIEERADGKESRTITGYGVVFDSWSSDLGWFKEVVRAEAIDEDILKEDIVATFNHNFDKVVARTAAKTLVLTKDKRGVKYTFEAPNTTAGNDLMENIRLKNVIGSSFIFNVLEDRWKFSQDPKDIDEREILKIGRIYELGPVVMPAYPDTTAAKRNHDTELEALKQKEFQEREAEGQSEAERRHRKLQIRTKLIRKKGY